MPTLTSSPPASKLGAKAGEPGRPARDAGGGGGGGVGVDAGGSRDRRRVVLALTDQGLVSGANFATAAAVGRWAGADELGLYALAFSLLILLHTVHESLILTPYAVRAPRAKNRDAERGAALAQSLVFMAASAIVFGVIGSACALLGASGTAPEVMMSGVTMPAVTLPTVMIAVAAAAPFTLLREFARRVAYADLRVGAAASVDAAAACLQLLAIAVLAVSGGLTAANAVLAAAFGCGVSGVAWLACSRRRFSFTRVGTRARSGLSLGGWIAASRLTSVACTQIVPWMLAWRLGLTVAGRFAAASTLVAATNPLLMGIGAVVLPHASRDYAEGGARRLSRLVRRVAVWMALVSALVIGLMTVAAGDLLQLIYGPGFEPFATTAIVLSVALLLSTAGFGAETALRVLERPRLDFIAGAVSLATTCVITLALIGSHGQLAGAAALAAGAGVASCLRIAAFRSVRTQADHKRTADTATEPPR